MSNIEDNGKVPYKAVIGFLVMALVGSIVYNYTTTVAAQVKINDRQDTSIDKLTANVLLLTQIVCQQKGTNCASLNLTSNK
jgi:hypothetical protein